MRHLGCYSMNDYLSSVSLDGCPIFDPLQASYRTWNDCGTSDDLEVEGMVMGLRTGH